VVGWTYGYVEPTHEATEGFATESEALARASGLARKRRLEEQAVSELSTFLRDVIVESVTGRQPSTLAKLS
jgi:hypothetical protein